MEQIQDAEVCTQNQVIHMAKKKELDVTNLVAECNPIYMYSAFDKNTEADLTAVGFDDFEYDGWHFQITVTAQRVSGYAWTRKNWELTGLYEDEVALVPMAANVQSSEPPLLKSKESSDKYMRVAELWTTQELTDAQARVAVDAIQPTLPGFNGGDVGKAYLDPEQLISGRSTVYCGNLNFSSELGFMSIAHQSIIGEGEPCASPDLHYVKAIYWDTNLNIGTSDFVLDVPATRDILTVAKVDMTSRETAWSAQVIRGSALDVL